MRTSQRTDESAEHRTEISFEDIESSSGEVLLPADSEVSPLLSVVMPTLNEEEGVAACIQRIKRAVVELGVPTEVIVSDSSTDQTPEIAREHGAIVVTPDKKGYGYAYRYAFERTRGEYIAIGDADMTYDFEDLPKLFDRVANGDAQLVLGSRLNGKIEAGAMPALHQYIGNPVLTKFLNVFYDAGVSDAHSGFRVIDRHALNQLDLRSNGMEFASEMVMKASVQGMNIEEIPITYHARHGEATLNSFHDGWRHVRFMLINAPGYVFSIPAALFMLTGIVLLISTAISTSQTGVTTGVEVAVMGSLLTIVGYQIGSLAIFSTITGEPIRSPRDPLTGWIVRELRLEHGVAAGVLLFTTGGVYLLYIIVEGIDLISPPVIASSIGAFTVIVLGLQTVFSSVFFGLLNDFQRQKSEEVSTEFQPNLD